MKKFVLSAFAVVLLTPFAAEADPVVVNQQGQDQVQNLPGNAQIVTGPNNPTVVIRNDGDSILYRALVAPYAGDHSLNVPNSANMNDVNSICGNEPNISKKNKCIGEVIKEREKLQKKYND